MIRRSILSYLFLSSAFLAWHPSHFLKDVLVAPLIFLVPLGLGLPMARLCLGNVFEQAAPFKLSLLLLSLFLGLTGQTVVYQQLERFNFLQQLYPALYPVALGVATVGFYREHSLLHVDSSDRTSLLGTAMLTPLLLLMYAFYYLKFAQYPLRDIFQETHFMKGAIELARFHILNPFTADSYIPLLQVNLGLLHDWYGYDLLTSQWLLPLVCAIVRYASLHCFFSAVTQSKLVHLLAGGLAIITLQNLFSPTNGDMLFSVCLVLMAVLIRIEKDWSSTGSVWLFLGALMLISIVLYKVSTVQTIGNYWIILAAGIAVYSRKMSGASAVTAQSILLCATGVALHPAVALLYLFCSLGIVGIHRTILSGWSQWREAERGGFLILLAALTALIGGFFALLLRQVFQREKSPPVFQGVAEWILGKEITGAEGLRNTIIEWIRLAPPAFLLLFSVLIVFQGIAVWRRSRLQPAGSLSLSAKICSRVSPSLIFAWAGSLAGLALSFSGLPYVHRALYFPLTLGCLLIAFLLCQEIARYVEGGERVVLLKYGIVLLGFLIVSGRYGYRVTELGVTSNVPYVRALSPYFGLTILGMIILLGAAAVTRTPWRVTVLILPTLFLGVVNDKFAVKSYGYRYSYGDGWVQGHPISHYTHEELRLAARLHGLPVNTILMSDPYTLSIVQAETGLNGLYTFSNLGVMREEYRHSLREILRYIRDSIETNQAGASDEILGRTMKFLLQYPGAFPETKYVFQQKMGRDLNEREIMDSLVIILNTERTFQWMDGKENYFPFTDEESIPIRVEEIAKVFQVIQNVDDKIFALRLK